MGPFSTYYFLLKNTGSVTSRKVCNVLYRTVSSRADGSGSSLEAEQQVKKFDFVRNPGRDISFPIFIRKEIETRKLERKSKQKISSLNDLLYRLNEIISR